MTTINSSLISYVSCQSKSGEHYYETWVIGLKTKFTFLGNKTYSIETPNTKTASTYLIVDYYSPLYHIHPTLIDQDYAFNLVMRLHTQTTFVTDNIHMKVFNYFVRPPFGKTSPYNFPLLDYEENKSIATRLPAHTIKKLVKGSCFANGFDIVLNDIEDITISPYGIFQFCILFDKARISEFMGAPNSFLLRSRNSGKNLSLGYVLNGQDGVIEFTVSNYSNKEITIDNPFMQFVPIPEIQNQIAHLTNASVNITNLKDGIILTSQDENPLAQFLRKAFENIVVEVKLRNRKPKKL